MNMPNPVDVVIGYHEATKHHYDRAARSLGYMDWANQPDPFRRFAGAPMAQLPFPGADNSPPYTGLYYPGSVPPVPVDAHSLSAFLLYSLGLSAWKTYQGTRWELRCNPSSGNLHPTEGYVITGPVPGLSSAPGVYHYAPREHGLERRAVLPADVWSALSACFPPGTFLAGLSSVHWREVWKYGERGYRYCNHDVGHALAALAYSAAALGWRVVCLDGLAYVETALLLGLDREEDFRDAESEHPDLIAAVVPVVQHAPFSTDIPPEVIVRFAEGSWTGRANRLSAEHVDWPIIDAVGTACRKPRTPARTAGPATSHKAASGDHGSSARTIFRQRRSAVAMDGRTWLGARDFFGMLRRTLPAPEAVPWEALPPEPFIHLALFVHRVRELEPGLYFLVRNPSDANALRAAMKPRFLWREVSGGGMPLYLLEPGDVRNLAARLSCQQAIAGDGIFSVGMIARFEDPIRLDGAWRYPCLFREAGVIGQALYLEAEARGVRGTGIGCYFDDPVHETLGLCGRAYQSLYHFTVGGAVEDSRLTTLPPYDAARLAAPAPALPDGSELDSQREEKTE